MNNKTENKPNNILIVGSGFSGSILARELANNGARVTIYEARAHIGGNCYTEKDQETGIITHSYGPHIFHTDDEDVWNYLNQYSEFMPYVNRVKTTANGAVYSLPINLHTINQFFNKCLNPEQAKALIQDLGESIQEPQTFEEQGLKLLGSDLYKTFFEGYTLKQWGVHPSELPASILKRLPVRFNYDDNYFSHKFQGIPKNGYTPIFEKLLDHEDICIQLNHRFRPEDSAAFDHTIYTGPIDQYFQYKHGRLKYRTLTFDKETLDTPDYQGCAVMNYADKSVDFTRITEHKHFAPWNAESQKTIIYREYSKSCEPGDEPYYPMRMIDDKERLNKYIEDAISEKRTSFIGRLATYRYLDMDVIVKEALQAAKIVNDCIKTNTIIPAFFHQV